MSRDRKLLHHSHTGRLRPHEHTSYLSLGILLFVVGNLLVGYTGFAASPPPEASSVALSGTVPAKPPTTAAVIQKPEEGQSFSNSPITVSGTCPTGTVVEIFKNNIFAGSAVCDANGTFSVAIDLLIGQNTLIAKVYDALNQAGPPSAERHVTYNGTPLQAAALAPLGFGITDQLVLNTDAVFRGVFPDQELRVPVSIIGGAAPYALNIQWGDATNSVYSRSSNTVFNATHVYKKAGTYQLSIQATDVAGRVAFLSVAVIVNGQPDIAAASAAGTTKNTSLLTAVLLSWPLYTAMVGMVISFWLGERREKHILMRQFAQPSITS